MKWIEFTSNVVVMKESIKINIRQVKKMYKHTSFVAIPWKMWPREEQRPVADDKHRSVGKRAQKWSASRQPGHIKSRIGVGGRRLPCVHILDELISLSVFINIRVNNIPSAFREITPSNIAKYNKSEPWSHTVHRHCHLATHTGNEWNGIKELLRKHVLKHG